MKDEIIDLLRGNKLSISGEEICKYFHISRAAIWKHIQELRKDGYEIEAIPNKGYRLISCPDKLFPREIKAGLKSKKIGCNILFFDTIESTMDVTFRSGLNGEKEGLVVIAEEQTKGQGRLGRKWSSPKGKGIYMSILLRPKISMVDMPKLTLMSSVAICEVIRNLTGINADIKWPNDIIVNNKKLSGILTEMNAEVDVVHFIVIGIGINVNTLLNVLPDNSTSIKNEIGSEISRVILLQEILLNMEKHYLEIKNKGFGSLINKWKQMSSTIGKDIFISDASGQIKGKAIDLDEFGRLIIKGKSGEILKKSAGDIIYV